VDVSVAPLLFAIVALRVLRRSLRLSAVAREQATDLL
jgi:hypothetical protein